MNQEQVAMAMLCGAIYAQHMARVDGTTLDIQDPVEVWKQTPLISRMYWLGRAKQWIEGMIRSGAG